MYSSYNVNPIRRPNNERFGGFIGPLLLGGVAGYAIGNNTNNGMGNATSGIIYPIYPQRPYYYTYPMYPYTTNTSNYYYY